MRLRWFHIKESTVLNLDLKLFWKRKKLQEDAVSHDFWSWYWVEVEVRLEDVVNKYTYARPTRRGRSS